MNIFRQLRWKLTFSYTLVTVGAFLVVTVILGAIVYTQIFVPENVFTPEGLVGIVQKDLSPYWSSFLSESPVDIDMLNFLLRNSSSQITSRDFLSLGAVRFSVKTVASYRVLIIGNDGILLGTSDPAFLPSISVGQAFDLSRVPGLEVPFNAALAGETDPKRLHSVRDLVNVPYGMVDRFSIAVPIFSGSIGNESQVIGIFVFIIDAFPTQKDIPSNILNVVGRSVLIFLLGTGIMGAIFGAFFAHGLSKRFTHLSKTLDAWSEGDFSKFIDDTTGDEVGQFTQRLDEMAIQLQSLLYRRQEMAVSEERNKLARDLHDSAKQQALAASFELGTALTLFERDPAGAKRHLSEAEGLVDAVRRELTNLVAELRPTSLEGQDFSEILKDHALEWSQRSGIELNIEVESGDEFPLETREALFRIAQEGLANITRHSSASCVNIILEYGADTVTLIIEDDGCGFDTQAHHGGLGLNSMRERAENFNGDFTIESIIGQVTRIVVTMPKGN